MERIPCDYVVGLLREHVIRLKSSYFIPTAKKFNNIPKTALKISGFTLSVSWLVDKIAKLTKIFLPTSTPTPPTAASAESFTQPMSHQTCRATGREYFILKCFSINGWEVFVALCFGLWVEEPHLHALNTCFEFQRSTATKFYHSTTNDRQKECICEQP